MEQTLGHVTHYQNLQAAASRQTGVLPTWISVPFETSALERWVPGYRDNWSVRASVRARRRLARELAARSHQAIFFHTQVTALFSTALMRRVPSIVSLDATPINYDSIGPAYGHRAATGTWLDRRKTAMNRDAFHAARALVTWSEWAKSSLVRDYAVAPEDVTVIPPGASRGYFTVGESRSAGPRNDVVRLLFVGGDFIRKGGPLLLASAAAARTQRAFELHVVTRQPVDATPGVIVHRDLRPNSAELLRLFHEADAFILPSDGDCLPLVVMEASAAGLPIVATSVGAIPEAASPGRSALLIKPGDGRALRAAIEAIVDDEALRLRLGRAAYALARARFDAERNGQRLFDLIASVARPTQSRSVA